MQAFSDFWSHVGRRKTPTKARIAFTDSCDPRVLKAFHEICKAGNIQAFLIGPAREIYSACKTHDLPLPLKDSILEIGTSNPAELVRLLLEKQKKFGLSEADIAIQLESDTLYLGIALLLDNRIDGLVSGATRPTADVVKAALRCIGPKPSQKFVSGQFFIESAIRQSADQTPFLLADCAVVPEPSARTLALIALNAADSYRFFTGKQPQVALLSFSTRGSAEHPLVDRIREALAYLKENKPYFQVDGELQADAALDLEVARIKKAGDSPVAGRSNVFIFPTLESGNIGYKLVQRFSNARVAGPILWGLNKPMSDLSRGCTSQEVTDTAYCVAHMVTG